MKNIIRVIIILSVVNLSAQEINNLQKAFEKSYFYEKENQLGEAVKELTTYYSEDSYEINLRLGWLTYQKGDLSASEEYYSKALKIFPYSEEAKFGLILPKLANAKWGEVIELYNQILAISPNNTTANYRLGTIYYNQKKFGKSHSLFEKLVNLYPFDYKGLLMYAWSSLQIGKTKEAKILFNKVLLLSPKDKSALEGLSVISK